MRILVTGAAGFIGYHTCLRLLQRGEHVYGVDNINRYFAPGLKTQRVSELLKYPDFRYDEIDLSNQDDVQYLFDCSKFRTVIHLAGQAGVRYSISNPEKFIRDNVVGFSHVIEHSRRKGVYNFLYASSSSVYGDGDITRASVESDNTDYPTSLYAATKKANEVIAQSYTHLYGMKCTGLRFFTVYGPFGRPDMAAWIFTDAIMSERPFDVFNYGNCLRDFTYVDDVVECVLRLMDRQSKYHEIYNIGNERPVQVKDVIYTLEKLTGKKALARMKEHQRGDATVTWADTNKLREEIQYVPNTPIELGLQKFVTWFTSMRETRQL